MLGYGQKNQRLPLTTDNTFVDHIIMNKNALNRLVLFVGVGGIATLLQFILLALFVELRLLPEVVASAVSYGIAAVFSYLVNYHFTFASNSSHLHTLPKFIVTAAMGLGLSTLLFAIFLFLINQYLIAQILASGLTLVFNYLMHKLWIYRKH